MKRRKKGPALLFFLYMTGFVMAMTDMARAAEDKPFILSPTVGWYFPTSSKTREAFGDSWGGIGVTLNMEAFNWSPGVGNFSIAPYFGLYYTDHNDNDAYVIPVGLEARWNLTESGILKPYVGLGAAVYGVKFEDRDAGVDTGWRGAWGGRVMVGADITKWFNVQAAYNLVSDVKDYDLSGFSIQGKFKIYF